MKAKITFTASKVKFPEILPQIPGFIVSTPKIKRADSDSAELSPQQGVAFGFRKNVLKRAVGEAVERFSLFIYKKKKFPYKIQKEIPSPIYLSQIISRLGNQKEKNSFTPVGPKYSERIYWFPIRNWVNGEEKHIPANFVYPPPVGGWPQFNSWTSNGVAANPNIEKAILYGVCEVLERDSIANWFLAKGNTLLVPHNFFEKNKQVTKLETLLRNYDLETKYLLIKNEMGVVTVVSLITIRNFGRKTLVVFGSSCKFDLSAAAENALLEAIMVARTQILLQQKNKNIIKSPANHVLRVPYRGNKTATASKIRDFIKYHPQTKTQLVKIIRGSGYTIYYADITPEIINDSNYKIVRAFVLRVPTL